MRRRERFVILSVLLGVLLWAVQLISPQWRYMAIGLFSVVTYFGSAWALKEDLQAREWLTILPVPAMYSLVVSLFYFLLPDNFWSKIFILGFFALGMYIILLAANIFSVAKERTIALLNTAQSSMLFVSLLLTLLGVNVIWSFNQPFYFIALALFGLCFFLTLGMFWSINLEEKVTKEVIGLTIGVTFLTVTFGVILAFLPLEDWHASLLLMSFYYLVVGVVTMSLKEKLFAKSVGEYGLIAAFVILMFFILFPWK